MHLIRLETFRQSRRHTTCTLYLCFNRKVNCMLFPSTRKFHQRNFPSFESVDIVTIQAIDAVFSLFSLIEWIIDAFMNTIKINGRQCEILYLDDEHNWTEPKAIQISAESHTPVPQTTINNQQSCMRQHSNTRQTAKLLVAIEIISHRIGSTTSSPNKWERKYFTTKSF